MKINKLICDRCGKDITNDPSNVLITISNYYASRSAPVQDHYDLCGQCHNAVCRAIIDVVGNGVDGNGGNDGK